MKSFATRIIEWQKRQGRHDLPWQGGCDPYRVWLSEIMLQQTQVTTVIPYFLRFVARFPTLRDLARASEDDVLALWSGLGYYSRARNLHAAARRVEREFAGHFPDAPETLVTLPGIGRSTAAAIAALAFGKRHAILDGNVKRVLARHGGIDGWPGEKPVEAALWQLAEARLPVTGIEPYTQGMMDLGAGVCTRSRPDCQACPVREDCVARVTARTTTLPTPRPKKALPERTVQMLLLLDDGAVLLEKRPSRGIWGGLWSLPEVDESVDAAAHCASSFGVTTHAVRRLEPVTHGFTHFRLQIRPVLIVPVARVDVAGHHWLPLTQIEGAALAAPVRKIVGSLN